MKTNIIIGQSGGPTSVINMTSRGVGEEAYHTESIDQIYGMRHGLEGILGKGIISLHEKMEAVTRWSEQPGAILGGSRYSPDETDRYAFRTLDFGYASAMAIFMLLVRVLVSVVYLRASFAQRSV